MELAKGEQLQGRIGAEGLSSFQNLSDIFRIVASPPIGNPPL